MYSTQGRVELYEVVDGVFGEKNTLVLANAGTSELITFDSEGNLQGRAGRRGEGPGEFVRLEALVHDPSEGVIAYDGTRLTWFDGSGEFSMTRLLPSPSRVSSLRPLTYEPDGSVLAVFSRQNIFQQDGERRDTVPLIRIKPTEVDTLGTWPGLERGFASLGRTGVALVPIGFARSTYYAASGSRIVIGSNDSIDVTVYEDGEPVLRVVGPGPSRSASPRDVRQWRARLADILEAAPEEDPIHQVWMSGPVRETLPAFDGLQVDTQGRIWIGEYVPNDDDQRQWVILAATGEPMARLQLPKSSQGAYPRSTELLAIGSDRLAVLRRDQLDEEYVEVWSLPDPLIPPR